MAHHAPISRISPAGASGALCFGEGERPGAVPARYQTLDVAFIRIVETRQGPKPAKRPVNSCLDTSKIETGSAVLRDPGAWR